jgi:hypothetical protein
MLRFNDDYAFSLSIVNCFKEKYPNVEGEIAPYRGASYDSEGLTITVSDVAKEAIYRISLFSRYREVHGTPVVTYCVKVSELRQYNNGTAYKRFRPMGYVDVVLKAGAHIDGTLEQIVGHIADLFALVKFTIN